MKWWLALALALVAGCSSPRGLVLWHAYNGAERAALEHTVAAWNAAHPDRLVTAGRRCPTTRSPTSCRRPIPRGNGPDLFIYPQDRLGDWADANVIEPIEFWVDDARADRFTRESLEAMAYRGSLWGLPMAVKSLALFYNPELVPTPPRTTDELLALAQAAPPRKGIFALAYPTSTCTATRRGCTATADA